MICAFVCAFTISNVEAFSGSETITNERDLYNATNTYQVNTVGVDSKGNERTLFDNEGDFIPENNVEGRKYPTQYNISYNMSVKVTKPIMDTAQITVLTHGLGADAGTWSNQYSSTNKSTTFAYDKDSIISQISDKVGGATIYYAKCQYYNIFNLYELILDEDSNKYEQTQKTTIEEVDKHIIIVFETDEPQDSNANIYYQFNYVLSKIIYDVSLCNPDQKLPKVNLIGHSRGGLTNLQYALDHPDLVSTMVSIGTPFFGSTTATVFGEDFMGGATDGLDDILDAETYNGYYTRWNTNYETLYKDIRVCNISSFITFHSLCDSINLDLSGRFKTEGEEMLALLGVGAVEAFATFFKLLTNNSGSISLLKSVLQPFTTEEKAQALAEILVKEIKYVPFVLTWESDLLVDLDSQQGIDKSSTLGGETKAYKGFVRSTRLFTSSDIFKNQYKVSSADIPIAHNIEARDEAIISRILNFMFSPEETLITYENEDGTLTVSGYNGTMARNSATAFEIPTQIGGKTVTSIATNALCDLSTATEITLPATITEIGPFAFLGLTNLTKVNLASNSQLQKIGQHAFSGCSNLTTFGATQNCITIPNTVTEIGSSAFNGCAQSSVSISANVNSIGSGAFASCPNLTTISVDSANANYFINSGVLYSYAGSLEQYPTNKEGTTFTVPTTLTINNNVVNITDIDSFAFTGNQKLTSVNLQNVVNVGSYAFRDCTNLATISGGNSVESIYLSAFEGTQIDLTVDFVVIGEVLIKYNGTATTLNTTDFPQGITRIATRAFENNETLETVYLPENIDYLDDYAFFNCSALTGIYDVDTSLPDINVKAFAGCHEDFKYYCRKSLLEGLTSEDAWYYEKSKAPISTTVTFVTNKNGGEVEDSELDIRTFYYGEEVDITDQLVPEWYIPSWHRVDDTTGEMSQEQLSSTLIWNELVTSATYKAEIIQLDTYTLRFVNGEELVAELVVNREETFDFNTTSLTINGQTTSFPTLQNCSYKDYYGVSVLNGVTLATFTGWTLEGKAISTSPDEGWNTYHCFPTLEVKTVWTPTVFRATLDSGFNYVEHVSFNYFDGYELDQVDFVTEHYFLGWYDSGGRRYENLAGVYESIALTARWEEYVYRVTLSSHGYMDGATEYRFGVSGATFILPQWETTTGIVVGWLDDMDREIAVGTEYEIYTTVTLEAIWEGKWFDVNYSNITFMGQTAGVFVEGGSDAPVQYQHGEGLSLLETYAHFDVVDSYAPRLVFLGWYTDMTFTTITDQIFINQSGAVNVYAKWRYDFGYGSRSGGTRTVTSDGQFTQVADNIPVGLNTTGLVDELIRIGITKLHIKYKINMWEVVDGSQYIYFYGGADGKTLLTSKTLNVGTAKNIQVINVEFDLENLGEIGTIYVRYKASQSTFLFWTTSHNWQNDHIYFEVCYVAQSGDETAEDFTWAYRDTLA